MGKTNNKSPKRTAYRDVKDKFNEASKRLSLGMHQTRSDIPSKTMIGYEINAGNLEMPNGDSYQIQLRAVRYKKMFIKNNELKPILAKWAIMFKVRVFLTGVINEIFKK